MSYIVRVEDDKEIVTCPSCGKDEEWLKTSSEVKDKLMYYGQLNYYKDEIQKISDMIGETSDEYRDNITVEVNLPALKKRLNDIAWQMNHANMKANPPVCPGGKECNVWPRSCARCYRNTEAISPCNDYFEQEKIDE